MNDVAALGRVIRRLRKARGLSQETLAFESGINRSHLSTIERGHQQLTLDTLYKLAKALQTSAVRILVMAEKDEETLLNDLPGLPPTYLDETELVLGEILEDGDADEALSYHRIKTVESFLLGMKFEREKRKQQ